MPKYKIMYIIIGVVCVIALIAGIYVQFFVREQDKNNLIMPDFNFTGKNEAQEKTAEEIKTQFLNLFTNEFQKGTYNTNNINKLDSTKDIIYTAVEMKEKTDDYEVDVSLPVMNISGEVPAKFNNLTQTIFANKASEIIGGPNTQKTIYSVYYTAYVNGDILSLVIQSNLKIGNNPQRVIVQTYNYNLSTGEEVRLADILANKNIIQSDAHNKIIKVVTKAKEDAQTLVQSGYVVYNRDLSDKMYKIENVSTYCLGPNGELYIIFAYGNNNYTSEMDIVLYE